MNTVRIALAGLGTAAGVYGAVLLLTGNPTDLRSIALWFAGCIIVHDLVLAPLFVAGGLVATKVLPTGLRPPLAVGAMCTLALLAVATPVFSRQGAIVDNPTLLDRNYHAGLLTALLVLWGAVALVVAVRAVRAGRGGRRTAVPA